MLVLLKLKRMFRNVSILKINVFIVRYQCNYAKDGCLRKKIISSHFHAFW